jgi:hypothetical protein
VAPVTTVECVKHGAVERHPSGGCPTCKKIKADELKAAAREWDNVAATPAGTKPTIDFGDLRDWLGKQ